MNEPWYERLPVLADRARCAEPKTPKGTRKKAKRAADRVFKTARSVFRALIFRLDLGRCRKCGKKVWLKVSEAPHVLAIGHVHEWLKRSLGGDPLDRLNCLLLCAKCHDLVDDHKLEIVASDETRLMRGPVEFIKGAAASL